MLAILAAVTARQLISFVVVLVIIGAILYLLEMGARKAGNPAVVRVIEVISVLAVILWAVYWIMEHFLP